DNGSTFTDQREPGFPIFLAGIYRIFGVENLEAVTIIQTILMGILGFLFYLLLSRYNRAVGFLAGICISAFPIYGNYAVEILTEPLFIFLLGLIFLVLARILWQPEKVSYWWYVLLGFLCGYASLVRVSFLLFLPFMVTIGILLMRARLLLYLGKIAAALGVY